MREHGIATGDEWTTESVRDVLTQNLPEPLRTFVASQFNLWLTKHDERVRVEALRAAAGDLSEIQRDGAPIWHGWLHERADRIEKGS